MGAPTAPAIRTRSLRSRRPRRSSLNVEPASSWSTQEVASQPERSIEHLAYACRCPTTTRGPGRSAQAQGCIPQMWVIASVRGAPRILGSMGRAGRGCHSCLNVVHRRAALASGSTAAREREGRDPRLPDVADADILAREPEGALVHRVDRHAEVVAPAFGLVLHAAAADQDLLVAQAPERIVTASTGEAEARVHGGARDAVAQGDVLLAVHGHAAHPPVRGVEGLGPLVAHAPAVTPPPQVEPPDAGRVGTVGVDVEVPDQGLGAAEVLIAQAPQDDLP